jgi:hypothetical protein
VKHLAAAIALTVSSVALAQESSPLPARDAPKNVISVNVLYPIGGMIFTSVLAVPAAVIGTDLPYSISLPVEYERSISPGLSLFGVLMPTASGGAGSKSVTLGVGAGARAYYVGSAPRGLWTGVEVDGVVGVPAFTARIESGGNLLIANAITLSAGFGLGLTYAKEVHNLLINDTDVLLPAAGLRLSVGYAF